MPLFYNEAEHDRSLRAHDEAYAVLEVRREQSGRGSEDWHVARARVCAAAQRVREAARKPRRPRENKVANYAQRTLAETLIREGLSDRRIAEEVGVGPTTISRWRRSGEHAS